MTLTWMSIVGLTIGAFAGTMVGAFIYRFWERKQIDLAPWLVGQGHPIRWSGTLPQTPGFDFTVATAQMDIAIGQPVEIRDGKATPVGDAAVVERGDAAVVERAEEIREKVNAERSAMGITPHMRLPEPAYSIANLIQIWREPGSVNYPFLHEVGRCRSLATSIAYELARQGYVKR